MYELASERKVELAQAATARLYDWRFTSERPDGSQADVRQLDLVVLHEDQRTGYNILATGPPRADRRAQPARRARLVQAEIARARASAGCRRARPAGRPGGGRRAAQRAGPADVGGRAGAARRPRRTSLASPSGSSWRRVRGRRGGSARGARARSRRPHRARGGRRRPGCWPSRSSPGGRLRGPGRHTAGHGAADRRRCGRRGPLGGEKIPAHGSELSARAADRRRAYRPETLALDAAVQASPQAVMGLHDEGLPCPPGSRQFRRLAVPSLYRPGAPPTERCAPEEPAPLDGLGRSRGRARLRISSA